METWALVVGINKYRPRTQLNSLLGAVSDACDFADWALDPRGGNVKPCRLFFWTNPWPDSVDVASYGRLAGYLGGSLPEWSRSDVDAFSAAPDMSRAPYAQEIAATAEAMATTVREDALGGVTEGARVFVFFAGHGLRTAEIGSTGRQTCFVVDDFTPGRRQTLQGVVPCESLRRALRHYGFSQVLLFLDCCRTDPLIVSMLAPPLFNLTNSTDQVGWSVGQATQQENKAFETNPPNVRGAFSKTLMDGLRGCRKEGTDELSVEQLETYVKANISAHAPQKQEPHFDFLPKNPPILIVTGPPLVAIPLGPVIRLENLRDGERLEVIDSGKSIVWSGGPYLAGQPDVELQGLSPGLYELRVIAADAERVTYFRWPQGAPIDVPN